MAELERKDIISDDALMAPLVLNRNFETLLGTITKLKTEVGQNAFMAKSATNFKEATSAISGLVNQEKELAKVQNQLASAIAKENEQYITYKKAVDQANQSLKEKIALGDKDAATINKTNASLKELEAALKKNRQAYAQMANEEARSSKEGQKLLKTIQQQDKEFKDLNKSIGQHQANVGNYQSAMEGLDGATGGVISRFRLMGQQLKALLANPIVAFIAALVGAFVALNNAVNTYYSTSAEGEDMMKKRQATWDAFFLTLKKGWADVGEAVSNAFGENGLKGLLGSILFSISPALSARFMVIEQQAQKLAKITRQLARDHAADVVDDANTELKANKLIEISRNKLDYSAEQRMAALKEHNRIKKEQLEGDIKLAQDDLNAFDERIKLERKGGQLLEEDIIKRAQLEAALIKVQSDASSARTGFLKLEKALADEIHKDRIDALNAEFSKSIALKQAEVDKAIALVQKEVIEGRMIKADGDKQIAYIRKSIADDLIQAQIDGLNKLLLSEELTAEERGEIEKRLVQLKIDLNNALYDQVVELDEAIVKEGKSAAEEIQDIYEKFAESIGALFSSISDRRIQAIDDEIAALEEKTDRELELAGNNEAAKEQIELRAEERRKQLEAKKRADQARAARSDKAAAVISSLINTAVAYTKALPNIPLAVLTAVLGGIQTAAIVAQPIPQFYKGTDYSPEGPALVGERGAELKITPSGQVSLTPGVPTLDYLQAGTKIINHDETMRMLALSSLGTEVLHQREQVNQIDLAKAIKESSTESSKRIVKAVKSGQGNLFKQGILTYEQKIKEDGSKQNIRKSILGR